MNKKRLVVLIIFSLIGLLLISSLVSAVWWNPFSWFEKKAGKDVRFDPPSNIFDKCNILNQDLKNGIISLINSGNKVVLREGEPVLREKFVNSDYFVANVQGVGRLLKVVTITNDTIGYSNDQVVFKDAQPGPTFLYPAIITSEGVGTVEIRGETFSITYHDNNSFSDDQYVNVNEYVTVNKAPLNEIETYTCPCIDTDANVQNPNGRYRYDLFGQAVSKEYRQISDFCALQTDSGYSDGKGLYEYYCNDVDYTAVDYYVCPNGCSNGACVPAPTAVFGPPSNLVVNIDSGQQLLPDGSQLLKSINLKWNVANSANTLGYVIYRKQGADTEFVPIGLTGVNYPGFNDSSISGVSYSYQVRAVSSANVLSEPSNTVVSSSSNPYISYIDFDYYSSSSIPTLSRFFAPANPMAFGISSSLFGANKIIIGWTDSGTASNYKVYRRAPNENSFSLVGATGSNSRTIFVDSNVQAGINYEYQITGERLVVCAVCIGEATLATSLPSLNVSASVPSGFVFGSRTVTNVVLAPLSDRLGFSLSWAGQQNVLGYKIYRKPHGGGNSFTSFKLVATVGPATVNYQDELRTSDFGVIGVQFIYLVVAFDSYTTATPSSPIFSGIQDYSLIKPTLSSTITSKGISLSISYPGGASDSYTLFRSTLVNGPFAQIASLPYVLYGGNRVYIDQIKPEELTSVPTNYYYYVQVSYPNPTPGGSPSTISSLSPVLNVATPTCIETDYYTSNVNKPDNLGKNVEYFGRTYYKTGNSVSFLADSCSGSSAIFEAYCDNGVAKQEITPCRFGFTCYNENGECKGSSGISSNINDQTLQAPTNLRASSNIGGKITLTWDSSYSSSYTYRVFRSTSNGGPFTEISPMKITGYDGRSSYPYYSFVEGKTFDDTSISSGTTYYYQVRVFNTYQAPGFTGYNSPPSNTLSVAAVPVCASVTYTPWSPELCAEGSTQTRTPVGSPAGCLGATPTYQTRACMLSLNYTFDEGTDGQRISTIRNREAVGGVNYYSSNGQRSALFDGASYIKLSATSNSIPSYPSSGSNNGYNISFSAWFKTNKAGVIFSQVNSLPTLASTQYVPALYIDNAGKLRASFFWHNYGSSNNPFNQIISSIAVNDGNWHHVAVVYDGSEGKEKLYLNGALTGSQTVSEFGYVPSHYLFGAGYSGGWPGFASPYSWNYFTGYLDEVQVYSSTLSQQAVQELYNSQRSSGAFATRNEPLGGGGGGNTYRAVCEQRTQYYTGKKASSCNSVGPSYCRNAGYVFSGCTSSGFFSKSYYAQCKKSVNGASCSANPTCPAGSTKTGQNAC